MAVPGLFHDGNIPRLMQNPKGRNNHGVECQRLCQALHHNLEKLITRVIRAAGENGGDRHDAHAWPWQIWQIWQI